MNINKSEDDIYFDDEIDVKEIIIGLWKRIWLILSITLFVSIASVVYAVSLPDIYKTQAILSPIDDNNSNGNSLRGYNNLANSRYKHKFILIIKVCRGY